MNSLFLIIFSLTGDNYSEAWKDYKSLPVEEQQYTAYLSLHDVSEADRDELEKVVKVVCCSLSRNSYLPGQVPERVFGTSLLKINLFYLQWSQYGLVIEKNYPYYTSSFHRVKAPSYPLVVSALWFVTNVLDSNKTGNAQELLIYGEKPPKNLKELLDFWKVQQENNTVWGFLEGVSGVANSQIRTIQSYPTGMRNGYAWITFDFEKLDKHKDPLERLSVVNLQDAKVYDASEIIISLPKQNYKESGNLQVYALCDNKGVLQNKAPAAIVTDSLLQRGPEIINSVSCIGCHSKGLIAPTKNEYKTYVESGARVFSKSKEETLKIHTYLENDIEGELKNHSLSYEKGIALVCGSTGEEFSKSYLKFLKMYYAPLTLEQAAMELEVESKDLIQALGYNAIDEVIKIDARVAQLAHGITIPRERWEQNFYSVVEILSLWNTSKEEK